ncbi:tRNA (uridine(54)-C5)-methyltransferase TrmA [Azonexus sp.]|uniref:tRNA (uridine(54)-C5)-methyltransferase TrmA n=1 Tax=Azonexus sp. TaxID=1872668 RepID=UPI0039E34A62
MPFATLDTACYPQQLAEKKAVFQSLFASLDAPEPSVFASRPEHYRMRAEFRAWRHDGVWDYAMFDPANPRQPVLLQQFPVADAAICSLMPRLRAVMLEIPPLCQGLYGVEFLATLAGDMLVTLIYRRALDTTWTEAAHALAETLGIALIGRSRGQKIVLTRDWVEESLQVNGENLRYRQYEGAFSQPNAGVNQHMLAWAQSQAQNLGGKSDKDRLGNDLLELYCGNGNFTVALAPFFDKVLATEMSKVSVAAAEHNLARNGCGNVSIARLASEEISAALQGVREFRRLREIDLASYRFSTLFVDPPRSGLDPATLALAAGFDNILYISCNPHSLQDNVAALAGSHHIAASAIFDQFPYTAHLECGLLLQKNPA